MYAKDRYETKYQYLIKKREGVGIRIGEITIALSNLSIYYTWKNIKNSYHNNKSKISAPIWNDKFELPDRLYSVSDIQNYFEYIYMEKILINHQYKYM